MRIPLILLMLSGCAGLGASAENDADALARELAGRVAGQPQSCITPTQSRSLTVADDQTLLYRAGDTLWVNRLSSACPGIEPLGTLIVEVHGSQYCRNDQVRGLEAGASIPGPTCRLGDFVPWRRVE